MAEEKKQPPKTVLKLFLDMNSIYARCADLANRDDKADRERNLNELSQRLSNVIHGYAFYYVFMAAVHLVLTLVEGMEGKMPTEGDIVEKGEPEQMELFATGDLEENK